MLYFTFYVGLYAFFNVFWDADCVRKRDFNMNCVIVKCVVLLNEFDVFSSFRPDATKHFQDKKQAAFKYGSVYYFRLCSYDL